MQHYWRYGLRLLAGLAGGVVLLSPAQAADWRESATQQDKVGKLVRVMPGASEIMLQVGERYKNLYWAAKQGKWEFAEYQTEELEELIEKLQITRPKRAETAGEFLRAVFPGIRQAAASRKWSRFEPAFEHLRRQCVACHARNDHGFITLPIPKRASSPVLNMD